MSQNDAPIKKRSEDQLGFHDFAENIAKRIISYRGKESIAIGLYGDWGFGKTSFINMMIDYIETDVKKDKPIMLTFNPWNFSDQNSLLLHYFDSLKTKLKKHKSTDIKKAGEYIEKYSKVLSLTKYIPTIGPIGELLSEIGEKLGVSLQGLKVENDIEELRKEINKLLIKSDKKILVIIDDIDRLNNNEIRQVFQLVKKLSDFQNTIFLLSFSKDIILNALKEIQIGNGFEYLEKIIQFPYELPKISKEKLEKILLKGIEEIIKVNNIENWDKYYWDKYYYRSLKNNFRNLRHIKRFMNIFEFIPGIIGNEVNSVDQAVMSAIQIFYPKIFNLIKENEDRFTGRISEYDFESNYYKSNIKSLRVEYDELISNATDINSKTDIINLLKILFPKFDTIFDGKYYQAEEYQEWVDKCRICIPEIYETYFRLTVPEYELSRKEFENVIKYSGDLDTLTKIIGEIEHQGKTSSFLEKIINNIKNIENEKAISIINILFDLADGYKSPVKKSISRNFQMDDLIFMSLNNLLLKFKDIEERYNIIKEAIERSNSLFLSVHFISSFDSNDEEKEGKEEEGKENDKIQLLEKPQIELLKNILVSKIKNWAEDDILINHFRLPFLLYRLERWDESNYIKEYLFNICKDDDKLVKLISRFLVRTSSYSSDMILSNESFDLYYNDLKHFIDVKEIEPRIRKIYQDKYMQEEESIEKIGLYLFLEYYDRKRHIR